MVLDFHYYGERDTVWKQKRRVLISVPGGQAYDMVEKSLGKELQTVWLGSAKVHETQSIETSGSDHPYCLDRCVNDSTKTCWQCVYIAKIRKLLSEGCELVACTTNVYDPDWVAQFHAGSSEMPEEGFQEGPPKGWGRGKFRPAHQLELERLAAGCVLVGQDNNFEALCGVDRKAQEHPKTKKPLGVGCRWERRFLDSLRERVIVVAQPPRLERMPECFYIESKLNGLVLDVADNNMDPGAKLTMWPKNSGSNQLWIFTPDGHIESKLNGLVLDIRGSSRERGETLIMWSRHGSENQKWEYTNDGSLKSKLNGLVLDVKDGNCDKGAALCMWPWSGSRNQRWILSRHDVGRR